MVESAHGPVVIVGAGQGGLSCALALRSGGWTGPITLVGREPHQPYERPPLSKQVLVGAVEPDALVLAPDDALAEQQVQFVHDDVVAIDRDARTAMLRDGGPLHYDHLVLATGAVPRRLPADFVGVDARGVHVLRTIDDALAVAHDLDGATDVVVVGGGYLGTEASAAFASVGRRVALLSATPTLLARVAPSPLGQWVERYLQGLGVVVHTSATAASITTDADGRASAVTDTAGREHPAQLVLLGIGADPDVDLARAAGLTVDGAIVVDGSLRTDDPAISAIGDCAVQRGADGSTWRPQSVQAAQDQGAYVAARLLGTADGWYAEVPWFYSDVGEARLQMVGRMDLATDLVLRGDPGSDDFSLFGYDDGRLVGAATVNRPRDYLAARALLRRGRTVPPEVVADPSSDLRALSRAR